MKKFYFTVLFLLVGLFGFGQSTEVGVTEGELSVSLTGAANYKIPIAVPPGINGVVPQISLVYNSQGGLGLAGFGWNIMGVSAITRVPSTMYHDGIIDPVDFNSLDRFSLDDKRLILKSSEKYGVAGTKRVYETEMFSNLKITCYSGYVQNNAQDIIISPIDYFIVEYPDGSSAKYENHGSATDWTISSWENPQGVYITYEYNSQYSGTTSPTSNSSIEKIKYGSLKSSGNQINEIEFIYKPRIRTEQAYVGGKSFIRDKILSSINVKCNGTGFRSYFLNHDTSSLNYERLKSITEKSGDGTKTYNPTVFDYKENITNRGITTLSPTYIDGKDYIYVPKTYTGDFDGDGDLDFMNDWTLYTRFYDDGSECLKTDVTVLDSNRGNNSKKFGIKCLEEISGDFKLMNRDAICVQNFSKSNDIDTGKFDIFSLDLNSNKIKREYSKQIIIPNSPWLQDIKSFSGDFNGDGLTDLILVKDDYTSIDYDGNNLYRKNLFFVNLDRRVKSDYVKDLGIIDNVHHDEKFIVTGDVNGDGKTDLIFFRGGSINSIVVYTLDENNDLIKLWETPYPFIHSTFQRKDIILYENLLPGYDYPILSGDFNNDGKTDLILPGLEREMLLSTGSSFVREKLPSTFVAAHDIGTILVADFNNDGKMDVLNLTSNHKKDLMPPSGVILTIDLITRFNTGSWTSTKYNLNNLNAYFKSTINPIMVKPSKLFGGKPELLLCEPETGFGYTNNVLKEFLKGHKVGFFVNNDALIPDIINLKSITKGNGVKETITYSPLIKDNVTYMASSYIGNFPNIDIESFPGFQVVSKLEKQSKDSYIKKMFSYYGAVSNTEGLGFLGFRSTAQTNWHNDASSIISYISKNDILLRGANTENYAVLGLHEPLIESPNQIATSIVKEDAYEITGQESLVASKSITLKPNTWIKPGSTFSAKINPAETKKSINEPSSFIIKSILEYEGGLTANKVFKVKNTSVKQFNGLDGTNSDTKTEYNNYNNPTKVITTVKEGNTAVQTTVTDLEYQNIESPVYIVGRPLSKVQQVTLGSEKMRAEEKYEYNAQQLLSEIKKKGDVTTNEIKENRVYDTYGNITKRTLKAGQDTREFDYIYDASGRFMTTEKDAERLTTTYLYNSNGTLKSMTNPLGQTTAYEYDSWFKRTKETDYLGNRNDYTYVKSGSNTILTKTYADGNKTEETFDDLGRKIKSGYKNIMGTFTYISYLYDIQDRNYKISEPYIGTAASQWNETKYDDYGRITSQSDYTGKVTSIDNNTPLTTKINDGTISRTYKKDAVGNVVSMFDVPANEIKYTYFANGELKESNYDGIKTKFLQDGWGRKKQIDDPSAGIFKYTYNDFGELISEENNNGITTYKLTPAGRLGAKTISGLYTNSTTTYTYDANNKLLLNTKFEDFSNGNNTIVTDFIYDDKKRMSSKTEKTSFAVFTKNYQYDSFGHILTEASIASRLGKSSAKTVKYTYLNGMLYQIFDNSTNDLLWQTNTINARGQLLSAQNGPLTLTNAYDSYGYNTQLKFDKTTPFVNVLSLNTNFNTTTGNLNSRTNNLLSWSENFKYDNLDRLTEFTGINGVKETQVYDDKGRIVQNSLGTFTYSNQKPYQNVSITVSPEALSYYTAKPSQIIDYNVFKSPVLINEKDVDKVSFDYNYNNSRTAMFYGSLQDEKLLRPLHKYYSVDGTMEIKENINTGVMDFVTYIGGDGYSAPIVFKSDGSVNQKYLFLQRDYQNSIVAVTDKTGAVVEKRFFDAWGAVASVQDGAGNALSGLTVLDRGYTGHEHLQSVGLINMNARLYDPKLHRFLQPDYNIQDPFNTQNYNRYGYVMNNPLRYTDPSGEVWNVVFGYLFAAYVKGAYESGGQLNPAKWTSNAWTNVFSGAASSVVSNNATARVNSYIDNYNNKPALGASAVTPAWYSDLHPFGDEENFNFKYDPNNVYKNSSYGGFKNGDIATIGVLSGGFSGVMNELPVVQFHNAAPVGKFAANYNGSLRYWSDSFRGGTKASISGSAVQAAKSSSNSLKLVSKFGGYASTTGSYLGYYGAAENLYNKNYYGAVSEFGGTYFGNFLAKRYGSDVGIAWTIGWNVLGPWLTNTEVYNRFFFGKDSAVYQNLEIKNGWYESKIFKD